MKVLQGTDLAYYEQEASVPGFWEERWKGLLPDLRRTLMTGPPAIIFEAVSEVIPKGERILEAGCGIGTIVYGLTASGWRCTGVDFAAGTIEAVKSIEPEIDIVVGDVRALPFPDGSFRGYISAGVIEHFHDGYGEILSEMDRVLKPGGAAIISFPAMNRLRRSKKALGLYSKNSLTTPHDAEFYQFALDHTKVVRALCSLGYLIRKVQWYEGLLGLADETPGFLGRFFRRIYNNRRSRLCSVLRRAAEPASWLTGYCCQIVAIKR